MEPLGSARGAVREAVQALFLRKHDEPLRRKTMARRAAPPYRAGVVGVKGPVVGGIGDAHARALKLHPKAEVVAICDIDPAGLEAYQAGHGSIAAFTEVT